VTEKSTLKSCFVIAPIGPEGSEVRDRSDKILRHIIEPVVEICGYEAVRADAISEPGIVTHQIVERLLNTDLVIADLTGHNANVFYELAIRHMVRKPVVQIIKLGEIIPFDTAQNRTIQVDHRDLDSVAACKDELRRQIQFLESNQTPVDTPISTTLDLQTWRSSDNPTLKSHAEIIALLQGLQSQFVVLTQRFSELVQAPAPVLPSAWEPNAEVHDVQHGENPWQPGITGGDAESAHMQGRLLPDPLNKDRTDDAG
jgi:hypothetical protein